MKKRQKFTIAYLVIIIMFFIAINCGDRPGLEKVHHIIDDWIEDSEYKDRISETYTFVYNPDLEDVDDPDTYYLRLRDDDLLKLKLKRHWIFSWRVDEESLKIVRREE